MYDISYQQLSWRMSTSTTNVLSDYTNFQKYQLYSYDFDYSSKVSTFSISIKLKA